MVDIFWTSTPSCRNSVQKKWELVSVVLPDKTSLPMITMPAVLDMRIALRKAGGSEIKLAATHEKVTIRIRTSKLAFFIDELRAANWTIIPPVLLRSRLP